MNIILDEITRKKLILVRQLFQRAILQAEAKHSYVDRIMALIGFDLTNETILKAVVSAINSTVTPKNDFQAIVQQADNELVAAGLPLVPDKARIQHVRTLRNDAQHKAKYPNETDVSDCRTYTRDFLRQITLNVWNENFDSISLIDIIQNEITKNFLVEAESHKANKEFGESIAKSTAALDFALLRVENSIVGYVPFEIKAFVVSKGRDIEKDEKVFKSFMNLRDLNVRSAIGLNLSEYFQYKNLTDSVAVTSINYQGSFHFRLRENRNSIEQEAEFVLSYVTNSIIQIESLVGDITKPFNS